MCANERCKDEQRNGEKHTSKKIWDRPARTIPKMFWPTCYAVQACGVVTVSCNQAT
jgi:hypothetical protein